MGCFGLGHGRQFLWSDANCSLHLFGKVTSDEPTEPEPPAASHADKPLLSCCTLHRATPPKAMTSPEEVITNPKPALAGNLEQNSKARRDPDGVHWPLLSHQPHHQMHRPQHQRKPAAA